MNTHMKKIVLFLAAATALLLSACVKPEAEPQEVEFLRINKVEVNIPGGGGEANVTVESNTSWTVKSNENWAAVNPTSGSGNGSFTIKVEANPDTERDMAKITVSTSSVSLEIRVSRAAGAKSGPDVTDCQGNKYPTVYIGEKLWMAENLKATKYSTNSERQGAELSISASSKTKPYYAITSDKNNWIIEHEVKLSDEQIGKLGILYNWAAAVGLEDGSTQTSEFTSQRQGICPDGWHIPTLTEWEEMMAQIEYNDGYGKGTAGTHLKTTTGWYENTGTDSYKFAALPAGQAEGVKVFSVGDMGVFQSATLRSGQPTSISVAQLRYDDPALSCPSARTKNLALSVRCVKN